MPVLEHVQTAMMQALDHGPAFLPDHLFAGASARVLAGMQVHANTISHARLVALEETFPRTLAMLGHARFNARSRLYLEQPGVTGRTLNTIGEAFPAYLAGCGEDYAAADLARFEWLWLKSYHAADAVPLRVADLAGLDESALLAIEIAAHPSACIGMFDPGLPEAIGIDVPDPAAAPAILIARPATEVLVSPASTVMHAMFAEIGDPQPIGHLVERFSELHFKDGLSADDFMAALIALMEAGAIILAEQQKVA